MNRVNALQILKNELTFTKLDPAANQLIAVQGNQKGLIYYLEKGWIKLSKISDDGRENSIDICAPGEFIGLPTLFKNDVFPVNITAITPCTLLAVSKNSLEAFLLEQPHIMAVLFTDLGEKVLKLREVKIASNKQDACTQVRELLIHFANIFGTSIPGGRIIPFNLTQQDIADFVGLSRPRVSVSLKDLLKLGFIRRQGRFYVLSDSPPKNASRVNQRYIECFQ